MENRAYIKYSPDLEKIPDGEAEDIQAVAKQLNDIQRAQYNVHRHCFSGTHARTQGIVKGKFIVPDDLPQHLKQGELFSKGGQYAVAARYSTEPGDPSLDDREPAPRGFAMKLFGVQGEYYPEGKDAPTQDIEFNSTPALDLATAKVTKEIIGLRMANGLAGPDIEKALRQRTDCPLQMGRYQVHNTHLESTKFYSQTAYRFGDLVMKYRLVPTSETQKKLHEEVTNKEKHPNDIMSEWLKDFHAHHEAEWAFQVQLLENLDEQPIEYAGTAWDEEKYPWQTVAQVVFPRQDSFSFEAKTFWEDHLRVDPWLGLQAYQPLGGSNRLRKVVYPASSALRRKMNARNEVRVKAISEIPGIEIIV